MSRAFSLRSFGLTFNRLLKPTSFIKSQPSYTRQLFKRLSNNGQFRFYSAAAQQNASKEPPKKGIKALMSKYGYSALGVYLGLSLLDLPLCFLLVHSLGTEKLDEWEIAIKKYFGMEIDEQEQEFLKQKKIEEEEQAENFGKFMTKEDEEGKPDKKEGKWLGIDKHIFAELGVAYAIHKSLIFIRLPITAAITPPIVRKLQAWGFNVGKGAVKSAANKFGTRATGKQRFGSWFF